MRLRAPDGQFLRLVNPLQSSVDWFLGRGYEEAEEYEIRTSRNAICEKNPWTSTGAAVHKDQAAKFTKELRENGIRSAHYDPKTGNLVCTSRGARAKALRLRGMHDRDGGYGD